MTEERKFPLRIEELTVIGGFLLESFKRDMADFTAYSPDYNNAYKNAFGLKLSSADDVYNPKKLIKELKTITDQLYKNMDALRPLLLRLEGYVRRAKNLTIVVKDFAISKVRQKLARREAEGLLMNLKILIQQVSDNLTPLTAKGYTDAAFAEMKNLRKKINDDNKAQNLKMDEKEGLVQNNMGVFNDLWKTMQDVMDAGKRIYTKITQILEKRYDYTDYYFLLLSV